MVRGHGVVGVVKRYGVGVALFVVIQANNGTIINLCSIGNDDARVLGDALDVLQVIAGPRRRLAAIGGSLGGRRREIIGDIRDLRVIEIGLRGILVRIQVDLGGALQRQALGDLVGELIVIRVVLVEVLGDGP